MVLLAVFGRSLGRLLFLRRDRDRRGGVIAAGACQELQELAEFLFAPVGTTAGHNGIIPEDHPLSVGPCFSSRALESGKPAFLDFVVNSSPEELMPPEFSIAREREASS